jgi:hypothetical protein
MLDPLCWMSSIFPLFREIVSGPSGLIRNSLCGTATALTLASVTCYFQWS